MFWVIVSVTSSLNISDLHQTSDSCRGCINQSSLLIWLHENQQKSAWPISMKIHQINLSCGSTPTDLEQLTAVRQALGLCISKQTFTNHGSDRLLCTWRKNISTSFVSRSMPKAHMPENCCLVIAGVQGPGFSCRCTWSQNFLLWLQATFVVLWWLITIVQHNMALAF